MVESPSGPHPSVSATSPPDDLRGAYALAEKYDVMTTTHVAETSLSANQDSRTRIDYLDPYVLLGHCVHVTEADVRRLAATDTRVAHNAVSNLKLGFGVAPVPTMLNAGVTVGIGTDDSSTNDTVEPLSDLKFTSLVQRGHRQDVTVVSAQQTYRMTTVDTARAVGRPELGHLTPGTLADIILVDLDQPHMQPSPNIARTLVHGGSQSDVVTTICNGRVIYQDGEVPGIDAAFPTLTDSAAETARAVSERAGLTNIN